MGEWAVGLPSVGIPRAHHHPEINGQGQVFSEAVWTLGQVGPNHVGLGGESVGLQAL